MVLSNSNNKNCPLLLYYGGSCLHAFSTNQKWTFIKWRSFKIEWPISWLNCFKQHIQGHLITQQIAVINSSITPLPV